MDTVFLRAKLHEAVDRVVDELVATETAPSAPSTDNEIEMKGTVDPFAFPWPGDFGSEDFTSGTAYRLKGNGGDATVVVGWTTRYAWNADRGRAVVFHRVKPGDAPAKWYPWTEFVETDSGEHAAAIPDPQRPRALLKDGAPLPEHLSGKKVARADEVFRSIRDGASLRLVVSEDDEEEMVRHGYWVAKLRGRI
jgi:hypothetical protein